jgi:DNA-binding GntR family transcriptional regulator
VSFVEERSSEGRMRHRTMAEYALEQLREAIILGELPAGTPLRLDELARSLGMSISPIREAVRQLEALGLAKHVPHQGARVLDFDIDELRDLFRVRLALESLAVRRAAERFTDQAAAAARRHLDRFDDSRGAGDVRRTMRAHTDFHFSLYDASQSQWLVALIRPPWDRSERYRPALLSAAGEPQDLHRDLDERLLRACVEHDPAAAEDALYEHLELASVFFETELGGRGIFSSGGKPTVSLPTPSLPSRDP